MSKTKAIINGLLAKQYKLAGIKADSELGKKAQGIKTKIEELISSDDPDEEALGEQLAELDKIKVQVVHNNAYGKFKKDELSKIEARLRKDFTIEEELEGDELLDKVSETFTTAGKAKSSVKDEEVENHPKYVAMQKDFQKQLKAKDKEKDDAIKLKEGEFTKRDTLKDVHKDALLMLDGFKPIKLSAPESASAQTNRFLKDFEQFEYKKEGNDWIVYKGGEPLKDDHGNVVDFKSLAETISKQHFDFQKAEQRQAPNGQQIRKPDSTQQQAGDFKFTGKLPTNETEYIHLVNDRSIPLEGRQAIQQHWDQKTAEATTP